MDNPGTRSHLIEQINGTLANIEIGEERVRKARAALEAAQQKAKSELGTAEREVEKLRDQYAALYRRLLKFLPEVDTSEEKTVVGRLIAGGALDRKPEEDQGPQFVELDDGSVGVLR